MDRNEIVLSLRGFIVLLVAAAMFFASNKVAAQRASRLVYNPILGRTVPESRGTWRTPISVRTPASKRPPKPNSRIAETGDEMTVSSELVVALGDEEIAIENHEQADYEETNATYDDNDAGYDDYSSTFDDLGYDDLAFDDMAYDGMGSEQSSFNQWCDNCSGDCVGDCGVGCGETVECECSPARRTRFYAGFEAVIVKPHFEKNVAFTVMDADGASFESFTDTEFDYDLEFTPRAFIGWEYCDGVGFRATWWQYDYAAATASANPPANGFGRIDHSTFGTVDISTVIPTDTFSAATDLQTYTIDLEFTKSTQFSAWEFGVGCGVRYAYLEQGYIAQLRDSNNTLRGQIDFSHSLEGYGPTISIDAYRPIGCQSGIFCKSRGSVLFGDGKSRLVAGEDLDLTTPFNTTRTTSRDDLLSIGEVQLGFRWHSRKLILQRYRPSFSIAMEGQIWNGAGSATSEDGTLGFYGFNTNMGVDW